MMYRPFDTTCTCGSTLAPMHEPHADNTRPSQPDHCVTVTFLCDQCIAVQQHTYWLPILRNIVSKNLIHYLKRAVTSDGSLLTDPINLNSSTFIDQKGLSWALDDLCYRGVLYREEGEIKLTLLGNLLLWHSPY